MTTFHGRHQLNFKTSSTQQPAALGDEFDSTAQTLDTATGIYSDVNAGRLTVKWVRNLSGSEIVPGTLVAPDITNTMDTDVKTAGVSDIPCGIASPWLASNVANGESFFIITKASRVPCLTGAAYTKGASLQATSAGKLVAGTGSCVRALEASTGADQSKVVSCDFSSVGGNRKNVCHVGRFAATIAEVNAGLTLLPAVPNVKYRVHDVSLISVGGAAGAVTTVDILGTQSASSAKLLAAAQANLTQNALLRAGGTGGTILAAGASFAECDVNTAITIGKTGSDVTTATHIHVLLTYEMVSA